VESYYVKRYIRDFEVLYHVSLRLEIIVSQMFKVTLTHI